MNEKDQKTKEDFLINDPVEEPEGAEETLEEAEGEEPVAHEEESEAQSIEKIKQFTEEDEGKSPASSSLRSILGGDFLTAKFVRSQLPLIILIAACFIIYISNRYTNQAELIEIDNLKKELDDARFNALTRSSDLTARSRQSYVEEFLRSNHDSLLQISSNSPFVIRLDGSSELPPVDETDLTLEQVQTRQYVTDPDTTKTDTLDE